MRRLLLVLVVLVLVNLPWAHEAWTGHRIDASGQDVSATVVRSQTVRGRHFVEFRLPVGIDPGQRTYTARIDDATYPAVQRTETLPVRAVPGDPALNRPAGEVGSELFVVVGVIGDLILGLVAVLLWSRRRRWTRQVVTGIDGRVLTFEMAGMSLTAFADQALVAGLAVGDRASGRLSLRAESDVLPAPPVGEVAQLNGARYRIRGRVSDVGKSHTDLELDNGLVLPVRTGDFRNRADLREAAEVTGVLELGRKPA